MSYFGPSAYGYGGGFEGAVAARKSGIPSQPGMARQAPAGFDVASTPNDPFGIDFSASAGGTGAGFGGNTQGHAGFMAQRDWLSQDPLLAYFSGKSPTDPTSGMSAAQAADAFRSAAGRYQIARNDPNMSSFFQRLNPQQSWQDFWRNERMNYAGPGAGMDSFWLGQAPSFDDLTSWRSQGGMSPAAGSTGANQAGALRAWDEWQNRFGGMPARADMSSVDFLTNAYNQMLNRYRTSGQFGLSGSYTQGGF